MNDDCAYIIVSYSMFCILLQIKKMKKMIDNMILKKYKKDMDRIHMPESCENAILDKIAKIEKEKFSKNKNIDLLQSNKPDTYNQEN